MTAPEYIQDNGFIAKVAFNKPQLRGRWRCHCRLPACTGLLGYYKFVDSKTRLIKEKLAIHFYINSKSDKQYVYGDSFSYL